MNDTPKLNHRPTASRLLTTTLVTVFASASCGDDAGTGAADVTEEVFEETSSDIVDAPPDQRDSGEDEPELVEADLADLGAIDPDVDAEVNRRPGAPGLAIEPAAPFVDDRLLCRVTVASGGRDDDEITYSMTWLLGDEPYVGETTTHAGDTVPAGVVDYGETWTCRATPNDGTTSGAVGETSVELPEALGGNILLLLIDDISVDKIGAYGEHPEPPPTPSIDPR